MRWNIGYFGAKDLFTLINLSGGLFGVYFAFQGDIQLAAYAIFAGYMFGDTLDGKVARLTNTSNRFGSEFDAVTDHFSQGIAPAVIVFSGYRMAGHETLGLLLMCTLIATASIRYARTLVHPFNYPLTWVGLPRTVSGIIAASLPNSHLFLQDAIYGYEGGAIILFVIAALNLAPIPYTTHKGRKLQTYVKIIIAIFFVVPVLLFVFAREFVFDFLFFWTLLYVGTGWIPLSPTERREFWAEYKRWSREVATTK